MKEHKINLPRDSSNKLKLKEISFTDELDKNICIMKEIFKNDNTFVVRMVQNRSEHSFRCAVFFFDGMVNSLAINESIIEPIYLYDLPKKNYIQAINSDILSTSIVEGNDSKVCSDIESMMNGFLYGDTVVMIDGDSRPVVVNTKGFAIRSSSEPDNEKVVSGPREGFTEVFMTNLSMIRRRIRTPDLKFSFDNIGNISKTTICYCYIEGLCDKKILKELKHRISKFKLDSALDSNYLIECIKDSRISPFPTIGTTERPDIVAAKLLEGRVAVIVDGTPVCITAPHIFLENFQSNDDYYVNFLYANLSRMLRVIGFLFTISIPAMYLSLLNYHPEIIPTNLLFSIISARQGVPLPSLLEALCLLLVFEILKEAGTRTPSSIGQTLSIVGALVLGQSAVEARFVSAPMVIIIAFSGITALSVPKLKTASLIFRVALLLLSSLLGLYGYMFGISLITMHLCCLKSFHIPYLTDILRHDKSVYDDVFIRFPWFKMKPSGRFLADSGRQGD